MIVDAYRKRLITEIFISSLGLITDNTKFIILNILDKENIEILFYLSNITDYDKEQIDDIIFEFEAYHGEPINIGKTVIQLTELLNFNKDDENLIFAKSNCDNI